MGYLVEPDRRPSLGWAAPAVACWLIAALTASGGAAAKVKLVFATWGSSEERQMWADVAAGFMQQRPDVDVEMIHVDGDFNAKLQALYAGGIAPDVIIFQDEPFPAFASKGFFLDITPFLQKDRYDLSDFHQGSVELFRYKGKYYGLPWDVATVHLYVNLDLLARYGIEVPNLDWTWDTLRTAAKKLTVTDSQGKISQYGFRFSSWWVYYLPWIYGAGGNVLNEPERTRSIVNSPEAITGIRFYTDLLAKDRVATTSGGGFASGTIAFQYDNSNVRISYKDLKGFAWDLAPMPKGPVRRATRMTPDGVVISAATKHPQESFEFLKYIAGPEGQRFIASLQRGIPTRRSVARSTAFLGSDRPRHTLVAVEALDYALPQPITEYWPEMERIIQPALDRVRDGKEPAEQAAAKIQPLLDELLRAGKSG